VVAKIYVEGAAQHSDFDRTQCRKYFSIFFAKAAGLKDKLPRIVPSGGRKKAYDDFVTAVKNPLTGRLPLLLVDSETAVQRGKTVWEHLKTRPGDNWDKPEGAKDDQAFLMVQVMETWFLADPEKLKTFFGQHFRERAIPKWPHLEGVSKETVFRTLAKATAACGPRRYAKGNMSFSLLAEIDPAEVEKASPYAKSLFERLRNL
jgi:hypothetical protein